MLLYLSMTGNSVFFCSIKRSNLLSHFCTRCSVMVMYVMLSFHEIVTSYSCLPIYIIGMVIGFKIISHGMLINVYNLTFKG